MILLPVAVPLLLLLLVLLLVVFVVLVELRVLSYAYRKIGVTSRTQAVLWAVNNGFEPDTLRTVDPAHLVRPAHSAERPSPRSEST